MRYRKLPVEVDAIKWYGGPLDSEAIIEWIQSRGGQAWHTDARRESLGPFRADDINYIDHPEVITIRTLEGAMTASVGDYIICGVKGEFYPCKPDIFEATYEEVS